MCPIMLIENVSLPFLPSTLSRSIVDPPFQWVHLFTSYSTYMLCSRDGRPLNTVSPPQVDHRLKGVSRYQTRCQDGEAWGVLMCRWGEASRRSWCLNYISGRQTDGLGIKDGKTTSGQESRRHGVWYGYTSRFVAEIWGPRSKWRGSLECETRILPINVGISLSLELCFPTVAGGLQRGIISARCSPETRTSFLFLNMHPQQTSSISISYVAQEVSVWVRDLADLYNLL